MPRLLRSSAVLGLAIAFVLAAAPGAFADTAPYTDLAAHGSVGLCDASGHPVTHGNIHDRPFVWRAVSSTPAAAPYDAAGRTATLVAYQPRSDAYPNQWSGDIMTSSSTYTNPRHPMAQASALDFSLADFLNEFPARWDGYLQLRMYLGVPGHETLNSAYPATDIKVTGDTWTVVRGASVTCTDGSARDSETVRTAPASQSAATHGATARGRSGAAADPTRPGGANAATSAAAQVDPAAARARSGSSSALPVIGGVLVAVLAGLAATVWQMRRRGSFIPR